MKQVTINSGKSLRQAIDAVIKEQMKHQLYRNAVEEKERQTQYLDEEDDDTKDTSPDEEKNSSKTTGAEADKLKKGEISSEDIIEKLNSIRSGKSFKDDEISSKLSEYVDSLSKAEKTALLAFLKGLAQIVTGEFEAKQAVDPADPDPAVKMHKGQSSQKKTIKPNVIKKPAKDEDEGGSEKKKQPVEDTSGPVPITPKRK